jgi:hypothetical protein
MVIVSLGGNCCIAYHERRLGIKTETFPLDWSSTSISQLNQLLENNFLNFEELAFKKISENHPHLDGENPSVVCSNKYKIKFAHEIKNKSQITELSEKILKRIQRFRTLKNPTFIRLETGNLSLDKMNLMYSELERLLDIYFLEYKVIVISINKYESKKFNWVRLEQFDSDWRFPNINWEKLFNM